MAIKLGGNTNITLTNTSFVGDVYPGKKSVPLFTAASNGTYYFEGDLQDSGTIAVSLNINSTPKEIWTYYDSVSHHISYEFTLVTGDVVEIEVSGYGTGSNLTVTRYADEPKEIFVGEGTTVDDYSAMQGPAPSGYHVPQSSEWVGLKTIMDGLSLTTGDSWRINLHMPFAGRRYGSNASTASQGGNAFYWSSSPLNSNYPYYARYFYAQSSSVNASDSTNRATGHSIRCFKDSYITPDSTWTVIQGTLGSAGIFWNQTEGLISITDGTTGYTIMDKNLGATTVYNNGDTLSEANCGKYYQRGNNYGFPRTGSITTSNTQVDASNYGPGNYYSSSTFITINSNSSDWSSVQKDDLWGGVTGVQQKQIGNVIEVYVGTTKVRPGVISYDIDDIKSGTAILPSETVKKMVIDFSTVNPGWTVFQMNGTSNHMYISSSTSSVVDISIDGFSTSADLSSYGRSSPSETSGTVELDFASDTYNINITSIIDGVSAPYSDSGIMNSNGPFAITDRVWQDFGGTSTGTISIVV